MDSTEFNWFNILRMILLRLNVKTKVKTKTYQKLEMNYPLVLNNLSYVKKKVLITNISVTLPDLRITPVILSNPVML